MPKVIFNYDPRRFHIGADVLRAIGGEVRKLVAEAVSTPNKVLEADDVDWVPFAYQDGTIAPAVSIEIETIGFVKRKTKLTLDASLELKSKILEIPQFPKVNPANPLLWFKYIDVEGLHI